MDGSTNLIINAATVAKLQGHAIVRKADGTELQLRVGMPLQQGDLIITAPGASANIQLADGGNVDCGNEEGDALSIDKTVLDFFADAQDVKVVDTDTDKSPFDNLKAESDFNDLEATAAGADGGDTLAGNSYVVLQYINTVTTPSPFFTTSSFSNSFVEPQFYGVFEIPTATPELTVYKTGVAGVVSGIGLDSSFVAYEPRLKVKRKCIRLVTSFNTTCSW
jgi:hypothetical protein